MRVFFIVFLGTRNFDLFESPLGQDGVGCAQITSQGLVPEPQTCRQRMDAVDLFPPASVQVVYNLDNPVVMPVSDSRVSVAADFIVGFGDRGSNSVRVEVASRRCVLEADDVTMFKRDEFTVGVNWRRAPGGKERPLIVVVFVVVAGDLLLLRPNREGLNVRMQETSTIADVFEGDLGAKHDFCKGLVTIK